MVEVNVAIVRDLEKRISDLEQENRKLHAECKKWEVTHEADKKLIEKLNYKLSALLDHGW